MANKNWLDMALHIDNSSASLTNISQWVNQSDLEAAINLLDTTGLGTTDPTALPGLHRKRIPFNFFVNSTTDGIFGPLLAGRTSVTKTVAWQSYSGRVYKGECWLEDVKYSGSPDNLEVGSATAVIDSTLTRTSVVGS